MTKKKKIKILTGSVLIALAVALFLVFYLRRQAFKNPEDKQVLFWYSYENPYEPEAYYGYFIDNYGNKVEVDLYELDPDHRADGRKQMQLMLSAEEKKITHQFSSRQMSELSSDLYQIDAAHQLKADEKMESYYKGIHQFMAIRNQEDGKKQLVTLYLNGMAGYWENPDPYAQKIMKSVFRKNPIPLEIDRYIYIDR